MSTQRIKKYIQIQKGNPRGFTLVELMVSLSIFSIVMVISVGTLLIMIDINAKAQALYSSTSNISFALDSMTREMRTGYHYYCGSAGGSTQTLPVLNSKSDCLSSETTKYDFIAFTRERDAKRLGYRLSAGAIEQNFNNGNWEKITSDDVIIDIFELTVRNSSPYYNSDGSVNGDIEQPTIDLFIKGHTDNGLTTPTDFSIQTRIVERRLDVI